MVDGTCPLYIINPDKCHVKRFSVALDNFSILLSNAPIPFYFNIKHSQCLNILHFSLILKYEWHLLDLSVKRMSLCYVARKKKFCYNFISLYCSIIFIHGSFHIILCDLLHSNGNITALTYFSLRLTCSH